MDGPNSNAQLNCDDLPTGIKLTLKVMYCMESMARSIFDTIGNLSLNPAHSVRADLYPSRELPGLFQPCDVLG